MPCGATRYQARLAKLAFGPEICQKRGMIKNLFVLMMSLLLATPLAAQTPMDADSFDAYTQGKTLYYGFDGTMYGAEEYLPNRRVRWSVLDGHCQEGKWHQDGQMICFIYEGKTEAQCWSFYQRESGLMAQFENDPDQTTLFETGPSDRPMICLGPEIGV